MKWVLLLAVAFSNYSFSQGRGGAEEEGGGEEEVTETVLRVNTNDFMDFSTYTVDVKETTTSYEPGAIEIITILDLLESDEIIITIPAAEEGDPIKVVFNIIEGAISNLKLRVVYEDATYDTDMANEEYFTYEGTTLTIHDTDQSPAPLESKMYLVLENGLAFTPNGDAAYDEISLYMDGDFEVTNIEFTQLNGTVVYTTVDKNFSWDGMVDGTLIDQGTYNYTITISDEIMQGQFLVQY